MTETLSTFNGTGANCSGSSGQINRVLTLPNTGLTITPGFIPYASGLALDLNIDYSVTHNHSGTTITFFNPMFNDMTIVVQYYQMAPFSESGLMIDDFEEIINSHGITGTLTRNAANLDPFGGSSGYTTNSYNIIFMIQNITEKDRDFIDMGLAHSGNSKGYFCPIYHNDITENGDLIVQTGDIITDNDGYNWMVEQIVKRVRVNGIEIGRIAAIRREDLNPQ